MADLRDVLRSFALKKMQELKDEGKEKDKRSRDESPSSSSKKKKKDKDRDRKRKDESSSSEHRSKRQALSESSKHDKHHHHHHHRSHREKSKDKDTGKHETKTKLDKDASPTRFEKESPKLKTDKGSEKLSKDTSSKSKTDVDLLKKVSEISRSDKDIHSKSGVSKEKDSNLKSPVSLPGKAPSKIKIIRKSFSSKDEQLISKEFDKKESTKSSKDVIDVEKKKRRDSSEDIIEIKQIKKAKVMKTVSREDDDIIEIKMVDNKKEEAKKMKKDIDETKKTKDVIQTIDDGNDKKKMDNLKKVSLEQGGKSESNLKPIVSATTTSNISMTTVKSGPKTEKKIIRINIVTKDLKVPTPPPSPPPKKPKKELEDGELSESQSDIDSDSEESDIDSDSEESEKEEETTVDGRKVPWREQGSSDGEASSSTDGEQDGKTAADGTTKTPKAKKQKHKHKHKKHKHKKDKENEKGDGKSGKAGDKEVKSEEKKSKHKKDKKEKKKDKKGKEDSKKDGKEEGEVKDKDNDKDKDRSKDKRKHRSRSRSKSRSRHSRRSRSPDRYSDRYYERSRHRSRSRSRERDRFSSSRGIWTRDLRARRHARSRSRDRDRRRRSRSYSPEEIDKKKLYEIAKANAYAQLQRGELPQNLLHKLPPLTQEDKVAQKAGGRTVKELTEVCMQLASKKAGMDDDSDSDASPINKLIGSDDDPEEPFIRHPFKVKDAPLNIVMNIRNAVPLPVKDKDTLRLQFPVSSGTQHRRKEDEISLKDPYGNWQIVQKDKLGPAPTQPKPVPPPKPVAVPIPDPILPILGTNITGPSEAAQALAGAVATTAPAPVPPPPAPVTTTAIPAIAPPPPVPKKVDPADKVFEETSGPIMDIGSIVSARLKAARALESNPHDVEALTQMHRSQTEIKNWTLAKQKPGMFTGSTGITLLSPQQLANSNPTKQAWAKKDMFHTTKALSGGIGMNLMMKMGWKQGEGLGIANQGQLEPLALDVKTDRKGLVALDEQHKKRTQLSQPINKDLSGKHPVSALMEICNKRRWRAPQFELMEDTGPAHKKQFMFKVIINGEVFVPPSPSLNKKTAKASAASAALQKMGLIPP